MLEQAASTHPTSWWWIKADGVDLVTGLGESMRMDWSGDVDLNDGKLEQQYQSYIDRLHFIDSLGLEDDQQHQQQLLEDLNKLDEGLESDLNSIFSCKLLVIYHQCTPSNNIGMRLWVHYCYSHLQYCRNPMMNTPRNRMQEMLQRRQCSS